MHRIQEVTIIIKLHKPVAVEQMWPDTIHDLLCEIGQLRYDDTEVIGFSVVGSDDETDS